MVKLWKRKERGGSGEEEAGRSENGDAGERGLVGASHGGAGVRRVRSVERRQAGEVRRRGARVDKPTNIGTVWAATKGPPPAPVNEARVNVGVAPAEAPAQSAEQQAMATLAQYDF